MSIATASGEAGSSGRLQRVCAKRFSRAVFPIPGQPVNSVVRPDASRPSLQSSSRFAQRLESRSNSAALPAKKGGQSTVALFREPAQTFDVGFVHVGRLGLLVVVSPDGTRRGSFSRL